MSTDTLIMVVLLLIGSALWAIGLGVSGYRTYKLVKAAQASELSSRTQIQQLKGRVQRLGPRMRELDIKQKAVAEKLESISTTARNLY
jgi:hypothetical protein